MAFFFGGKDIVFSNGQGIFKLLCEIFVDGLATLEDRSSVFKALYLFHNEASCVYFVFLGAVDTDDALPILLLLVR